MDDKTTIKKRRKYDEGFKKEALKMVNSGRSVVEVARTLGIGENLLYNWRAENVATQNPESQAVLQEMDQLRKQLRQVEMERDILKKVISILSPKT